MFSLRWAGGAELHHAGPGRTAPLQPSCHVPVRSGKTQSLLAQESGTTLSKGGCHSCSWLIFSSGCLFWSQANVGIFLIHSSSYSRICLIFKQHKCCTRQQNQEDNPRKYSETSVKRRDLSPRSEDSFKHLCCIKNIQRFHWWRETDGGEARGSLNSYEHLVFSWQMEEEGFWHEASPVLFIDVYFNFSGRLIKWPKLVMFWNWGYDKQEVWLLRLREGEGIGFISFLLLPTLFGHVGII